MYENGTKFKFIVNLERLGLKLGDTLQKLNNILYGVVEAKPYQLDWDKIIPLYKKLDTKASSEEFDKFCMEYVMGYALINDFSLDPAKKEAMYLHLRAELLAKKAQGDLN